MKRAKRQSTASSPRTDLHGNTGTQAPQSSSSSSRIVQLYGVAPIVEALRTKARCIERIMIAEGARHYRLRELLDAARAANIPVRRAPREALERAIGTQANHQGVIAFIAAANYVDANDLLDAFDARMRTNDALLAVVLDGVEDPRNLGAILRTAECAGAHGVFIPERRAVGLNETVAKTAAGALEYVPVARAANLVRLIEEFKQRNIWTVGTDARAPLNYTKWDWRQPCAVFFGGEGGGLHRLVRERCDALVSIPVRGHIQSLNVSVAAGVVLYEALRQRTVAQREESYERTCRAASAPLKLPRSDGRV